MCQRGGLGSAQLPGWLRLLPVAQHFQRCPEPLERLATFHRANEGVCLPRIFLEIVPFFPSIAILDVVITATRERLHVSFYCRVPRRTPIGAANLSACNVRRG